MAKKNKHDNRVPDEACNTSTENLEQFGPREYSRRDAIRAMGKYSAYVGTTAVVVLTAEDVVASSFLSSCYRQCRDANDPQYGNEECYDNCRIQDDINNNINN